MPHITSEQITATLHHLCELAAVETMKHFRVPVAISNKEAEGFDPVTVADKSAEAVIRAYIVKHFPDHGILGEEEAPINEDAEYCWIIDPIDGTRAYISGLPTWGTLIGLNRNGKPIAGVMHQPFTGEKYFTRGSVAYLEQGGEQFQLKTSQTSEISEATLMTTAPELFSGKEAEAFQALSAQCQLTRYGFDCYAYAMVAAGNIELVVESGLNAYDIVPLIPIIEAAGGSVLSWDGGSAAKGGRVIAAANQSIMNSALKTLRSCI